MTAKRAEAQHFANIAAMHIGDTLGASFVDEDVIIEADVTQDGRPYVLMLVDAFRFAAHQKQFGGAMEISTGGRTRNVSVFVESNTPRRSVN